MVHARSAVVDLYGDHLRDRGWWAPVASVVTLASTCDVQSAATRTAVSRLVREGWLTAEGRDGARGYAATAHARQRLTAAHDRIYADRPRPWDGTWHVVAVDGGGDRRRRDRVAASLTYLGYARLGTGTWISPWPSEELDDALTAQDASWTGWTARPDREDPVRLTARLWDLDELATAYRSFSASLPSTGSIDALHPDAAYRLRTLLVHEWRKFLFHDPGLPLEVLPDDWPGLSARARFLEISSLLRPAAEGYVDRALHAAGAGPGGPLQEAT